MNPVPPADVNELVHKLNASSDLTDTEKAYLREQLTTKKKYGLIWEDKPEAVEQQLLDSLPVLTEVAERRVINVETQRVADLPVQSLPLSGQTTLAFGSEKSVSLVDYHQSTNETDFSESINPDSLPPFPRSVSSQTVTHTLIEGDNLHALTVLNYTHAGQVDVIYIDPPYNTGNKDFKYNDTFVDREDSYRHSKWLSFMAKRLRLAKTLLKDTGVIFISIDDNEQAQLKLLCDEVFGEENFVANVIWQSRTSISNDDYISTNHNHTFIFGKDRSQMKFDGEEIDHSEYINPDNDPRGPWKLTPIDANKAGGDTLYPITNPKTGTDYYPPGKRIWAFNKTTYEKLLNDGRIKFGLNDESAPKRKLFLRERLDKGDSKTPSSILLNAGTTKDGTNQLIEILGTKLFDYPKPTSLIVRFLKYTTQYNKNALVLDFFAGSGTTLHAVMALNAEDGGSRRCILVTNNENNIAEEVCYERNRRVIEGYTNSKGVAVPGLPGNALRYYKTAFVGRERTLANKRALMRQATDLLCLKEECYVPAETPYLASPVRQPEPSGQETPGMASLQTAEQSMRLFTNPDNGWAMLLVYDSDAIDEAVALLKALPATTGRVKVYVFAPASYPYADEFEEVAHRVELCALPDAIYQAYEQAFNLLRA